MQYGNTKDSGQQLCYCIFWHQFLSHPKNDNNTSWRFASCSQAASVSGPASGAAVQQALVSRAPRSCSLTSGPPTASSMASAACCSRPLLSTSPCGWPTAFSLTRSPLGACSASSALTLLLDFTEWHDYDYGLVESRVLDLGAPLGPCMPHQHEPTTFDHRA